MLLSLAAVVSSCVVLAHTGEQELFPLDISSTLLPRFVINPSEYINVPLDSYFSGPLLNFKLQDPEVIPHPSVSVALEREGLYGNHSEPSTRVGDYLEKFEVLPVHAIKNDNIDNTTGVFFKSLLVRNEFQESVFLTINEQLELCQYDFTFYHIPDYPINRTCSRLFFPTNSSIFCYSIQGFSKKNQNLQPYLICAEYIDLSVDVNIGRDFIAPLIPNEVTHLYEAKHMYPIPAILSRMVEMFDSIPTYMVIEQIEREQGLYSTGVIYTVMGNGTSVLVKAFTQEWFSSQPGIMIEDYDNLNIIDFSVINEELVILVDSNKRLYIITFEASEEGVRKYFKLRKTLYFPEALLDVFVRTDLSDQYLVVKAARSSNLYIISVTQPDNPVLEREYVCWESEMCSLFTNNLGVTYNQDFVLSVQSDDYNEQTVLSFYKRGSDFTSIPYYRIDLASLRPDEIFVEFLDYRSNYFLMKTRNQIKIYEMIPHTIQFLAWPNNTVSATISFNVTCETVQTSKPSDYSVTQNLTLQLSPHNDTHSFTAYEASELIVLEDSALKFNINPLFIGSNLTHSFLAIYESEEGEEYSQLFDQEPMLKQSDIYESSFAKDCEIYRMERGLEYVTTNVTYEICFKPNSFVYQRNFNNQTRNEIHFGSPGEVIFRDVVWIQDLNAYLIFCTFNKEKLNSSQLASSTLALYYDIEDTQIVYFSSQHLYGVEVRESGAFYDEFSKVVYLVDSVNQTSVYLFRFLGCPMIRQNPVFLEEYKGVIVENGTSIQSIAFADNFSGLLQTERFRGIFDSRIEESTEQLMIHNYFERDPNMEFGEIMFEREIIIFQRNSTIRRFRLKDFNIWDNVELPLPPGFDYYLIADSPQYHRFFTDFILLLERTADHSLFLAEYDMESDLQGAVKILNPIDGSYFKQGEQLRMSTIEYDSSKLVMLATSTHASQVRIFNNYIIELDSCEIEKLKHARIVEKKSHMEVHLDVRKLNTTYNGLHVSVVDYPSSSMASPLLYKRPSHSVCIQSQQTQAPRTSLAQSLDCSGKMETSLQMTKITLNTDSVQQFVLENYFQGFSLMFEPHNFSDQNLSEAVQVERRFSEMCINLNISTTDRNLLAHIFFRKEYMFTYDSLSALSLYNVVDLANPVYLTETFIGKKGSQYDILSAGYCQDLERMIMIFIGSEEGRFKHVKTLKLLAEVNSNGQPVIDMNEHTSIAVDYSSSQHATFCYCKGAEYTIVIEKNGFDDQNKAIHIYEPDDTDPTMLREVIVLDAVYFHLSSFNATFIEVHKHFPVLFVALAQYGVIGIDLATFRIILDADFSVILTPSPTLPSYKLLSLVGYGDTHLIVSLQNLGTMILDIPRLDIEFYTKFVNAKIDMVPGTMKALNSSSVGFHFLPSYNLLSPTRQFIASDYYGVLLTHNPFYYYFEVTVFDFMAHRRSRINTSFRVATDQEVTNRCNNMASRWGSKKWQFQLPLHTTKFTILCDNKIYVYELDMFHKLYVNAKLLPSSKELSFDMTAVTMFSESSATIHFEIDRLSGPLSLTTLTILIPFSVIVVFFIFLMVYCRSQRKKRYLFIQNYKSSVSTLRDLSWRSEQEDDYDLQIYDTSKILSPAWSRTVSRMPHSDEKVPILSQGSVDSDIKSESSYQFVFKGKKELLPVSRPDQPLHGKYLRNLAEHYGCTEVQQQIERRKRIESGTISEAE